MTIVASATTSKLTAELDADLRPRREPTMNAATTARIAAWDFIANSPLPAGSKVAVEDGWVTIHPRGGQPARAPYGPADTLESLHRALKDAARTDARDPR